MISFLYLTQHDSHWQNSTMLENFAKKKERKFSSQSSMHIYLILFIALAKWKKSNCSMENKKDCFHWKWPVMNRAKWSHYSKTKLWAYAIAGIFGDLFRRWKKCLFIQLCSPRLMPKQRINFYLLSCKRPS